jgi:ligand-binding sensor domain-containing protein
LAYFCLLQTCPTMRLPSLFALVLLAEMLLAQDLDNLKFTTYTTKEGLASIHAWNCATDRHGQVWVSHQSGISRFDGLRFTNYSNAPNQRHGLREGIEYTFALDLHGKFWVCNNYGLAWYDEVNDRFEYVVPTDTSLKDFTRRVAADKAGNIWITGDEGLLKMDPRTHQITRTSVKEYLDIIQCDAAGDVWLVVFLKGLYRYTPQSDTYKVFDGVTSSNLRVDGRGMVWYSIFNSLNMLNPQTGSIETFPVPEGRVEVPLKGLYGWNLGVFPALTGADVLWIPTKGAGIALFDMAQRKFTHWIEHDPLQPYSLPLADIDYFWAGAEGTAWICSNQAGLIKLDKDDQQFMPVRWPFLQGQGIVEVSKVIPDRRSPDTWWVATFGKGLFKYDQRQRKVLGHFFKPAGGESKSHILYDIFQDEAGVLWVSSRDGLWRSDGLSDTFRRIALADAGALRSVAHIVPIDAETFWILAPGGVVWYNKRTQKSRFVNVYSDHPNFQKTFSAMSHLIKDEAGNALVSGFLGVHRVRLADFTVEKLTEGNVGESGGVTGCHEMVLDKQKRLWFGTRSGVGCYDFGSKKTDYFTGNDEFATTTCRHLAFDKKGQLWTLSGKGLCRLEVSTGAFTLYPETGGLDNSRNYTGPGKGFSQIGDTWYFTLVGANFRFDPSRVDANNALIKPVIDGFRVRNQPYPFGADEVALKPLELAHNQNFLTFDFTAFYYTQSEHVRFRYQLEGVDDAWNETQTNRTANYPNLRPGNYEFRVEAANSAGVWSGQVALFKVHIAPPWWATLWFRGLALLAAVGAVVMFFRNRVRKIRQQAETREREAGYKQREAELQREVAEFSKQVAEVELAALRAQMNPHFVFNCLNSINTFILLNDPQNASTYLNKFSKLIRRVLDASRSEYISLRDEVETLRYYIELEQMRYGGKFDFQIETAPNMNMDAVELPPMLIQPYVENAIWHGLMHREAEGGMLRVVFNSENGQLVATIEDNGVGRKRAADLKSRSSVVHKSHGMQVTQERLQVINELYGSNATVSVEDLFDSTGEAAGTRVTVRV